MLSSILVIPTLGALAIASMPSTTLLDVRRIKLVRLLSTVLTFIISMVLWGYFDRRSNGYQFVSEFNNYDFCHLHIGIDGISLYFVLLTTFTMPICILASWHNVENNVKYFFVLFLILERLLIAVFVVIDLLLFYVFFERVLIPLFLLVGVWGASAARVRASFLLFLYTLFGSLFMLLAFLVIIYNVGRSDLEVLSLRDINFENQKILWLAIFLRFAIKTPLVPFHLWLIRAHVEAPVGTSMILAGLVLKLARYGMMRILLPILPEASLYYSPIALTLGLCSIIYASLSCLRQIDFKCLVAYSSIAHMGVVILGLFSNTIQGIEGRILLSLGHGFVSPALFFIVGSVLYDRYHTRIIRYYRGLVVYMPITVSLFFLFICGNMGVPLTVNWLGEFMSLAGIFQANPVLASLGSLSIVLSASFSIWLFNRLSFGSFSLSLQYTKDLSRREFFILLYLLIPTFLFGLLPNIILTDLHYRVSTLLSYMVEMS